MKAVAYLRVSTDAQAKEDRFGLDAQREAIDKYAKQNNIEIKKYYIDAGISGATLARPELDRLLKDSDKKTFDTVIVAKLDRIARKLFYQLWIEKELNKYDINIVSVSEPYNEQDSMTVAFRQMVGVFAELEKSRISERMTGGRIQKAKTGNYSGGRPALGYVADKNTKSLTINADKTEAIKLVFQLRMQGLSFQLIANKLNLLGHTTALNKSFSKVQVKRIIDRKELYQGIYKYSNIQTEGKHTAILTA